MQKGEQTISRVLYLTTIYLIRMLPYGSSHHIGTRRAAVLSCRVLLRIGFAGPYSLLHAGELLPRLSTLTVTSHGGISLLHFPYGRPRLPLAAILPCEARTFLTHSLSALCPLLSRLLAFHIIVYFHRKVKSVLTGFPMYAILCYDKQEQDFPCAARLDETGQKRHASAL